MYKIDFGGNNNKENYWISTYSNENVLQVIPDLGPDTFCDFDTFLEFDFSKFSAVKAFNDFSSIIAKRDIFGSIPLFFIWKKNEFVIFSETLSDLLLLIEYEINEERISYYLNNINLDLIKKSHLTFFKDVYQVPAGAFVEIQSDCIKVNFVNYINSYSKGNLLQELKEKLERETLGLKSVAFQVSGGLDSTSLASIYAGLLDGNVNTHYCVSRTNFASCDENIYQEEFSKKYKVKIEYYGTGFNLLKMTKAYCNFAKHPPLFFNTISLFEDTFNRLNEHYIDFLVSGHGGDEAIGHGFEYIEDLKSRKRHIEIKRFVRVLSVGDLLISKYENWAKFSFQKKFNLTLLNFVYPLNKVSIGSFFNYLIEFKKAGGNFLILGLHISKKIIEGIFKNKDGSIENGKILSIPEINIHYNTNYIQTFSNVKNNTLSNYNETFFNLGILYNIKFIFPFLSTKVLGASATYTSKEKFGNGIGRNHLREEMKGVLPELIRNRIGKTSFDEFFVNEIKGYFLEVGAISDSHPLWNYVLRNDFENHKLNLLSFELSYLKKRRSAHFFHKVLNLKVWLDSINQN